MPTSQTELFALFEKLGIQTSTIEHAPVYTMEELQALHNLAPGAHAKNLFLRDNKKTYFLVAVEGDRKVDLKGLRTMLGAKGGLSFGSAEVMESLLGVQPGAVSPLAAVNDTSGQVKVFLDGALLDEPVVNCHPLINTRSTALKPADLVTFLREVGHAPEILHFAADEAGAAD